MNRGNDVSANSWPIVIIALCVFWPIGLYLLIRKLSADKKAALGLSGKGMKIAGIIMLVIVAFGALGIGMSIAEKGLLTEDIGGIIVLIFFAIGAIALLYKSNKVAKEAAMIRQYLSVIVNGNVRKLCAIASATGKPYDVVYKELNNIINKGYLHNAYIDEGAKKVVLPEDKYVKTETPRIVNCVCCGANNTLYGDMWQCEYCGSPLK